MSAPVNSPPVEGCQAPLDGVVVAGLHQSIPLLWRGVKFRLTGRLCRVCTSQFPSCGGNSPPVEGRCLAQIYWGDCIASCTRQLRLTGWFLRTYHLYINQPLCATKSCNYLSSRNTDAKFKDNISGIKVVFSY